MIGVSPIRRYISPVLAGALLIAVGFASSCQGYHNGGPSGTTGTVNTSISDPPTCSSTYDHIYITVTKVTANISADAGPDDSGWITLVDLTGGPKQIDLLSLASTTCVLTQLGSTSGLKPGNYQQIRFYLLDNSPASGTATPSSNACGSTGFNCVVPRSGSPQILRLSSEVQTGIKIPTSQITRGGLTITAGQSSDLDIGFDSCASIVREGNGKYRLKPVLHAGEISTNNNSISGTIVDQSSRPIGGALVLLEQPDSNKIDRVQVSGLSASDGTFIFCPLSNPAGDTTYDLVVAAQTSSLFVTTTYNTAVVFNVPVGTNVNSVTMIADSSPSAAGAISGQVTTSGSGGAVVADVTLSPLQELSGGSANQVTIPVFGARSQPPVVTTTACPVNSACFSYVLLVPAGTPQVGAFANGSFNLQPVAGSPTYTLEGVAPTCTGVTPAGGTINSIVLTAGSTKSVGPLTFTGCTAP